MAYPGVYRAKAVSINGTKLAAFIPQVFGDVSVTVENFVGRLPATGQMGWVSFQGGNPEFPVWHGGGGGGGTVTDVVWVDPKEPTSAAMELWYDTDETAPLDPRYLPSAGGAMTGHITLPSTDPPGTYSAVHHDWMMRWINLVVTAAVGNTAWGIMAQFPRLGAVSIATQVPITGNLNFTFTNGRRYRLVCYIRAVQVAAVQAGTMNLMNATTSLTGAYGGSVHYYVGPGYGVAYGEWIIDGTGQNHNALHVEAACATATAHMTANSQAYIEDVGPVTRT